MHPPSSTPQRIPQRVVVAGAPGPELTGFLSRLAAALDVPLVPLAELSGPAEAAALAAFDGWVTTSEYDDARPALLERADLVVHFQAEEQGTFRGLMRRTVRRLREGEGPNLAWLDPLPVSHPTLPVVRLAGAAVVEDWFAAWA